MQLPPSCSPPYLILSVAGVLAVTTFRPTTAGKLLLFFECSMFIYLYSAPVDFGHFITAVTVISGLALPLVLAHADVIQMPACYMSIAGGVLVYGTSKSYIYFFAVRMLRIDDNQSLLILISLPSRQSFKSDSLYLYLYCL